MRFKLKIFGWLSSVLILVMPHVAQAEVGAGTHLYLRCNSTSWDLNDLSRLKPGPQSFLRSVSFDVKETWMLETGDSCMITETPELNGWGTWQHAYAAQQSTVKVPESARLRSPDEAEDKSFRIRYPALGRYEVVLNTRDGYFSVRKASGARAGDVLWTLPGNVQSDTLGHLFLTNYSPENSLALVDVSSGLPRWTYTAASYISFYSPCSTADTVFLTLADRVVALSLVNGQELWSSDMNGALKNTYGYLSCYPGSDQLYLSYGSEHTTLASLNKSNGAVAWVWEAPTYAGLTGVDAQHVFINAYQDTQTTLVALDKSTGTPVWQNAANSGYYSIDDANRLYRVDGASVAGIAAESGKALWTYQGAVGDSIFLTFEQNRLFVHEKAKISSLDATQGRVIWTYDYSRYAEQYPYAQVLKTGVVLVRINDYDTHINHQIALHSGTGVLLWESEDSNASGYLNEDTQNGVWLLNGRTISAVDPWTGVSRWTYSLQSPAPQDSFMSLVERDGNVLYVSYGTVGSKYPPMGIIALRVDTGALLWQSWLETSVYRVGGDSHTMVLNAGYFGATKALKK